MWRSTCCVVICTGQIAPVHGKTIASNGSVKPSSALPVFSLQTTATSSSSSSQSSSTAESSVWGGRYRLIFNVSVSTSISHSVVQGPLIYRTRSWQNSMSYTPQIFSTNYAVISVDEFSFICIKLTMPTDKFSCDMQYMHISQIRLLDWTWSDRYLLELLEVNEVGCLIGWMPVVNAV